MDKRLQKDCRVGVFGSDSEQKYSGEIVEVLNNGYVVLKDGDSYLDRKFIPDHLVKEIKPFSFDYDT